MKEFLKEWNLGKHIACVLSLYGFLFTVANGLMFFLKYTKSEREIQEGGGWLRYVSPEEKKLAVLKSYVKEPTTCTKTVNKIIGTCFIVDMASYPIVKRVLNKK